MKNNRKLSRVERLEIKILLDREYSLRDIAKALKRSPNTISYEVRTNSVHGTYDPLKADRKAKTRKKIDHNPDLEDYIVGKLKFGCNPDEISGRMKEDKEPFLVSKTAIYEWLYSARGQAVAHACIRRPEEPVPCCEGTGTRRAAQVGRRLVVFPGSR